LEAECECGARAADERGTAPGPEGREVGLVEEVTEDTGDVDPDAGGDGEEQHKADYHAAHQEHNICGAYDPCAFHEPGAEQEAEDSGAEGREEEELVPWEADKA
tara:strand:+ start:818 stop:1129 length:312 start_codon:yes stop_codon:yes gene_type:complete